MEVNGYKIEPKADLRWANLCEANLIEVNLRWADLRRANLCGANLRWADLCEANLCEASLSKANLRWANLSKAVLRWADLSGADLSEANLSEANLSEANLSEANLSKVDLSGVDLSGANLRGANLRGANLRWAGLRGTDLRGSCYSILAMLRASWGTVSPTLTLELMRWDVLSCGPKAMSAWAKGGPCPFKGMEREFYFNEDKAAWCAGRPKLNHKQLWEALCKEKKIKIDR